MAGTGKFCVSLTFAKDNTDKATVAFVVANAAAASNQQTLVFLSIEGVRLSQKGVADGIHEEGGGSAVRSLRGGGSSGVQATGAPSGALASS